MSAAEENVLRLDVPVNHAVAVGVLERVGGLARDPERVVDRELPLAPEPVAQRLALDERHREPEPAAGLARIQHGEDVGMLQPGGERISRWKRSGPSVTASSGCSTLNATGRS